MPVEPAPGWPSRRYLPDADPAPVAAVCTAALGAAVPVRLPGTNRRADARGRHRKGRPPGRRAHPRFGRLRFRLARTVAAAFRFGAHRRTRQAAWSARRPGDTAQFADPGFLLRRVSGTPGQHSRCTQGCRTPAHVECRARSIARCQSRIRQIPVFPMASRRPSTMPCSASRGSSAGSTCSVLARNWTGGEQALRQDQAFLDAAAARARDGSAHKSRNGIRWQAQSPEALDAQAWSGPEFGPGAATHRRKSQPAPAPEHRRRLPAHCQLRRWIRSPGMRKSTASNPPWRHSSVPTCAPTDASRSSPATSTLSMQRPASPRFPSCAPHCARSTRKMPRCAG